MTTNEKQNEQPKSVERKELTPQQLQTRKKMVIFPLFFLVFAGCMWLIFAPDTQEEQPTSGFNTDLPTPEQNGIVSDKRDAYIQEEMKRKQQDKMRSLQDFAFELDAEEVPEEAEPQVRVYTDNPSQYEGRTSVNAFRSSADAYADINRQIGSFYTDTSAAEDVEQKNEMQARIEELERRLEEEQERKNAQEEQVALLEKSYEIAARYMNAGQTQQPAVTTAQPSSATDKVVVQPVKQVRRNIVSLLGAPMPDSVFRAEFAKPRNWGFNTVGAEEHEAERNSIRAYVYRTVTITDGGEVSLRLTEPMMAGATLIPAGTVVTGTARIAGERLNITVSAVQAAGAVIPVELSVYDLNGNEGISIPQSDEINAIKEIAANMGSGMGSSITITDDAGSQLLSDMGRSAIQGVSSYVSKKMRTVKVTVKADHKVLLLPPLK
ncbi:conjugative transposon protein TraM [Alistipes timonensis]|uniref:conjugative transposon protein TraM n=1 Tax=Alistipes timonensis TaxID=1465754 RepID=UPI00214BC1AD|nr:conjugative transposon protein TraM [Alistipes timonensis]MCR2031581.1 conjugative transposon protein TraM [Alistipes timonensis]